MAQNPDARSVAQLISDAFAGDLVATVDQVSSLERRVPYNEVVWNRWLSGKDTRAEFNDPLAGWALGLVGDHPGQIDRAALGRLSKAAKKSRDEQSMVRLFVATMIWGSGTTNGRGPRNTAKALGDEGLVKCLGDTMDLCQRGELANAYQRFSVDRVGPSFFTKWFWTAALHGKGDRPLILDDRVWATLNRLGWTGRAAAHRRRDRYAAYVESMTEWVDALNAIEGTALTAEGLEYLMFERRDRNSNVPPTLYERLGPE